MILYPSPCVNKKVFIIIPLRLMGKHTPKEIILIVLYARPSKVPVDFIALIRKLMTLNMELKSADKDTVK